MNNLKYLDGNEHNIIAHTTYIITPDQIEQNIIETNKELNDLFVPIINKKNITQNNIKEDIEIIDEINTDESINNTNEIQTNNNSKFKIIIIIIAYIFMLLIIYSICRYVK